MEWFASPDDLCEYRKGDRVKLSPATDRWMMGDRIGTVEAIGRKYLKVKMDRSGDLIRIAPSNLDQIAEMS